MQKKTFARLTVILFALHVFGFWEMLYKMIIILYSSPFETIQTNDWISPKFTLKRETVSLYSDAHTLNT